MKSSNAEDSIGEGLNLAPTPKTTVGLSATDIASVVPAILHYEAAR